MQPKKQKENLIFGAWVSKASKVELFSTSKIVWKPKKMEENLSLILNPYLDPTSKSGFKNLESQVIFYDKNSLEAPPQKNPEVYVWT
jgi:hypothetical protein